MLRMNVLLHISRSNRKIIHGVPRTLKQFLRDYGACGQEFPALTDGHLLRGVIFRASATSVSKFRLFTRGIVLHPAAVV